ncbi:MAG: rod shape-determining protein MreC [Cyclobacteriaceae bacterium]
MYRLLQFFLKYQAFFMFLLLEVVCTWFIVTNNNYQNAAFFNSSNRIVGNVLSSRDAATSFLSLNKVNRNLVEENAQLRLQLTELERKFSENPGPLSKRPAAVSNVYTNVGAKVIKNSTRQAKNYLTINKGTSSGIEAGMAVINKDGVVGKIKSASDHFATVTSILNPEVQTSSLILKNNTLCTTKWEGPDPYKASVLFVPRHVSVETGDSIVTSGFNAVYPPGIPIGIVTDVNMGQDFYNITIDFIPTYSQLDYVYVIKNNLKSEKDLLEGSVNNE